MRSVGRKIFLITLFLAAGYLTQVIKAQQPPSATVFEGARLITGDGSAPMADSAFVVENGRFTAVGRKGQVKAPAGAAHVDLTGKTVIPAIIDAHKHLAVTRDALVDEFQHFAYYGIGATMSLGQDTGDEVYQVRAETIPNAARYRTAGRGMTGPEPGRSKAPFWVTSEAEVRKAVDEMAAKNVDIIKFWVDDRDHTVTKLSPELYRAGIDEAHKKGLRTIAHIYTLGDAKGTLRAGIDNFAHSVRGRVSRGAVQRPGLARAGRKSAGQHHQYAAYCQRLSSRVEGRPRRLERPMDGQMMARGPKRLYQRALAIDMDYATAHKT